jgi:hypothetical protein
VPEKNHCLNAPRVRTLIDKQAAKNTMKLYGADNREMMQVSTIERDGSDLLIKGKIFGTMPLTAKLRPEEARAAFKLLGFRTIFFILTMMFRRSKR